MATFFVPGMLVSYSKADNQYDYVFVNTSVNATLILWTLQMAIIYKREECIF